MASSLPSSAPPPAPPLPWLFVTINCSWAEFCWHSDSGEKTPTIISCFRKLGGGPVLAGLVAGGLSPSLAVQRVQGRCGEGDQQIFSRYVLTVNVNVLFGFFIFHVIQMASTVYPRKIALNKHTRTQIVLIVISS